MNTLARRFRALPIRARLSMLVAAAVAFAVAAVSVTCWFIVQGKLYEQLDQDLQRGMKGPQQFNIASFALSNCSTTPQGNAVFRNNYSQVVTDAGKICVTDDSSGTVKVTQDDKNVIKSGNTEKLYYRDGTDSDGNAVRVMIHPLGSTRNQATGELGPRVGFMVAVPLKSTQNTLNDLALLLLLVSGVGVIGAGAAGLAVARAGLRPVDELTEAVEHVARTEDLSIRIPGGGGGGRRGGPPLPLLQLHDDITRQLPRAATTAHRGRRPRTAHPAHLTPHEHRAPHPQRGDGPPPSPLPTARHCSPRSRRR